MSEIVKRFIAGVVCPACGQMDKIRVYQQQGLQYRECVNCTYLDTMVMQVPAKLPTRVSPENESADDFQIVKLFGQD